jgi:hypothetical protein
MSTFTPFDYTIQIIYLFAQRCVRGDFNRDRWKCYVFGDRTVWFGFVAVDAGNYDVDRPENLVATVCRVRW